MASRQAQFCYVQIIYAQNELRKRQSTNGNCFEDVIFKWVEEYSKQNPAVKKNLRSPEKGE